MRLLPSLLILVLGVAGRLSAQTSDPITVTGTIPGRSIVQAVRTPAIDLRGFFAVPTITGPVVQFNTVKGTFNAELNSSAAPSTVANFLAYVNASSFTKSIVHRLDTFVGIIQGGGYLNNPNLTAIPENSPLALETSDTLLNARGTLAMARGSAPNTATTEWYVNTKDNSASLPPASSGGYAVFGRVTGTGMSVVDAIAALPVPGGTLTVTSSSTTTTSVFVDSSTLPQGFGVGWGLLGSSVAFVAGNNITLSSNANQTIPPGTPTSVAWARLWGSLGQFRQLPVLAPLPADNSVALANLVTVNTITAVPVFPTTAGGTAVVTFNAGSSNPSLVNAVVLGSNLHVAAAKNLTGSAIITVTATDTDGNSAQTTFNVSVTRQVRDFSGDGNADFLFQNSAGQIAAWYLNTSGATIGTATLYGAGLGDWRIVATADMNGDGIADFLFQNSYGQIAVWYLNASGVRTSSALLYAGSLGDWRIAATADINGDGNTDLIFQNNIGQLAVWYFNGGGSVIGSGYLYAAGLGDWRLKCAADMNGDGIADLMFQNSAGQIAVWYLNQVGTVSSSTLYYGAGLGDWKVAGTADINGDGIADILFQNNVGQIAAWYLNASGAVTSAATIYGGGLGAWRLH